jgi:AraC-like DNA-binding protein
MEKILTARSIIETQFGRQLKLSELAAAVNLSPSRFSHLFKAKTGNTFAQYLMRVRMLEARSLLQGSHLTVKEVMHKVGITDASYFTHAFRSEHGLTPSRCRTTHNP